MGEVAGEVEAQRLLALVQGPLGDEVGQAGAVVVVVVETTA